MNIRKIILREIDDFDWIRSLGGYSSVDWVEPGITLNNVERDEDDWPLEYGSGEGEIWLDVSSYTSEQKRTIIKNLEEYLGPLTIEQTDQSKCFEDDVNGYLVHCGHEEYQFFSQENHICCMDQTYEEFIEDEKDYLNNDDVHKRPQVDGGIFLTNKINEEEEFDWIKDMRPLDDMSDVEIIEIYLKTHNIPLEIDYIKGHSTLDFKDLDVNLKHDLGVKGEGYVSIEVTDDGDIVGTYHVKIKKTIDMIKKFQPNDAAAKYVIRGYQSMYDMLIELFPDHFSYI